MANIRFFFSTLVLALVSSTALAAAPKLVQPFSSEAYASLGKTKAVVILSANWGKKRYCGNHDAVHLQSFAFDKAGGPARSDKAPADFLMEADASVGTPPPERFLPYAWIIEPGEYHLSSFRIDTMSKTDKGEKTGRVAMSRKQLIKGGKPVGGKFTADAGDVIYLGHFFLNCDGATEPTLLRYLVTDKESYTKYLNAILLKFPPLEASQVRQRPFESAQYALAPEGR